MKIILLIAVWSLIILGCSVAVFISYKNKRIDKERAIVLAALITFAALMFCLIAWSQ